VLSAVKSVEVFPSLVPFLTIGVLVLPSIVVIGVPAIVNVETLRLLVFPLPPA